MLTGMPVKRADIQALLIWQPVSTPAVQVTTALYSRQASGEGSPCRDEFGRSDGSFPSSIKWSEHHLQGEEAETRTGAPVGTFQTS